MSGLHVVDHPVLRQAMSALRASRTDRPAFRVAMADAAAMLAYEALRELQTAPVTVAGPLEESEGERLARPVAPIATFADSEEAAIKAANDTEYGLVAYVYTRDIKRAFRVCEGLETGMIGLNQGIVSNPAAPFGGVKASGFGREGGREGIEEYLSTKYFAIAAG